MTKAEVWRHIETEDGDTLLALSNIICHLNTLLTDEQKIAINWHPEQSVSLAIMRIISDLSRAALPVPVTPPEGGRE